VVWARPPDRFEAGTPAIVNVIAFARALLLARRHGTDCFRQDRIDATPDDIVRGGPFRGLDGADLLAALRASRIGMDLRVPTAKGERPLVNLDNAASTPTFAPVWEAARRTWHLPPEARPAVAREAAAVVAGFLRAPAPDYEVIFTANTTEAIHRVAENLALQTDTGSAPVVFNTLLDHNSDELPWRGLAGVAQVRLDVDAEGFLDPARLESELAARDREAGTGAPRIRLVAVCGASNVLGSFNDLEEICRVAHRHEAHVLVDAAQWVAHRRIDIAACGIDFLAFSAHKAYAPFGSGALVARRSLLAFDEDRLERIRATGEENVCGLAAPATALDLLGRIGMDRIEAEEQARTAQALAGLATVPGLTVRGIAGAGHPRFGRRGGVIAFEMKGSLSFRIASELAERAGIGSRWGCHCAHMLIKHQLGIPPWAQQIQRLIVTLLPKVELPGIARVSLGLGNDAADVDVLVETLREVAAEGRVRRKELQKRMAEFVEDAVLRVYGEGGPAGSDRQPPGER